MSVVRDFEDGLSCVRVTYRQRHPLIVAWDGRTYRRWSERGYQERFPADPEEAADRIAEAVGARAFSPLTDELP